VSVVLVVVSVVLVVVSVVLVVVSVVLVVVSVVVKHALKEKVVLNFHSRLEMLLKSRKLFPFIPFFKMEKYHYFDFLD
jgi:hypothetical protein